MIKCPFYDEHYIPSIFMACYATSSEMVTVKGTVSYIVALCSLERAHFRGRYFFHVQDQRVNYERNQQEQVPLSLLSAAAGFLLGLLFGSEDGGNSFPPKCQAVSELQGITTQKTILFFLGDGFCGKSNILGFVAIVEFCKSVQLILLKLEALFFSAVLH
jgi:hypothetical protein